MGGDLDGSNENFDSSFNFGGKIELHFCGFVHLIVFVQTKLLPTSRSCLEEAWKLNTSLK